MQRTICSLFVLLTTLCVVSASAQSRKPSKDSAVVIIFNEGSTTPGAKKKKKGSSETNIVKLAPLGLLSGQFPILYERSITDFFSVQAGAGITHRNYIRGAWVESEAADVKFNSLPWPNTGQYYDEAAFIYDFEVRMPKMGFMATIQPRIYFASQGLDGSFVGLSFDYYRYKFETPKGVIVQDNIVFTGPMQQEFENVKDVMVNWGWQTLYDRISLEYTTGIGLRNITGQKYSATYFKTGSTSNFLDGMAEYKTATLNFTFGIKVGYHF